MRRFALCLLTVLSFTALSAGFAQPDSSLATFDDFERNMFFFLRIAYTDCPAEFAAATCYVHGYTDFFDFQDRFKVLAVDQLEEVSRWHRLTLQVGNDAAEVFQATYRLRGDDETFSLTFTQGGLLFITLEAGR